MNLHTKSTIIWQFTWKRLWAGHREQLLGQLQYHPGRRPAHVSTTWALFGWTPGHQSRGRVQPISAHVVLTCAGMPSEEGTPFPSILAAIFKFCYFMIFLPRFLPYWKDFFMGNMCKSFIKSMGQRWFHLKLILVSKTPVLPLYISCDFT